MGGTCARPVGLTRPTICPQLEQGLCCGWVASPDAPGGAILECLVQSSGKVEEELARPILYLVQALTGERLLGWRGVQVGRREMGFSSWLSGTPS